MRGDRGRFARITDNRGIKINVFSASLRRTETETQKQKQKQRRVLFPLCPVSSRRFVYLGTSLVRRLFCYSTSLCLAFNSIIPSKHHRHIMLAGRKHKVHVPRRQILQSFISLSLSYPIY